MLPKKDCSCQILAVHSAFSEKGKCKAHCDTMVYCKATSWHVEDDTERQSQWFHYQRGIAWCQQKRTWMSPAECSAPTSGRVYSVTAEQQNHFLLMIFFKWQSGVSILLEICMQKSNYCSTKRGSALPLPPSNNSLATSSIQISMLGPGIIEHLNDLI